MKHAAFAVDKNGLAKVLECNLGAQCPFCNGPWDDGHEDKDA
jgi:hypothetical protein